MSNTDPPSNTTASNATASNATVSDAPASRAGASASASAAAAQEPSALIGWRLLALFYDVWPVLALWMLVAVPFVIVDAVIAGDDRHNIQPFTVAGWLLWLSCWLVTGLYATVSWRRGGQTLGMRPWRLRLLAERSERPSWSQAWLRFVVGSLSLLLGGLGFWWAWFDRDKQTWHDRASGTRLVRLPKR